MLTVIEKVIFLQNVDVFNDVPTEQLAYLAAIAEEVNYLKGDDIYKTDDPSDAMFLVISGKVSIHRNGEEITSAGEKDAFGTWALFDEDIRIASATVAEDSNLLCILREDFYDLLADNVDITQGIFKMFVKRMRKLIENVDHGQ